MTRRRRRRRRSRRTSTTVGGLVVMFILVVGVYLFQRVAESGLIDLTPAPVSETVSGRAGWYQLYFTPVEAQDAAADRLDDVLASAILIAGRSVDLAAYDIGLQPIADALVMAAARGTRVRVVTETDNMDRDTVQQLLAAGIPVVDDQSYGLMHHKFVVIDGATVFTGSWNLTISGTERNNNNALRIDATRLAENYTAEFEEMFTRRLFGAQSVADTPNPHLRINDVDVENYFSPDDGVAEQILQELRAAQQSIYFMAFSFTREDFSQVLKEKAAAGVAVRGVYETQQIASGSDQSWNLLSAAGLDVLQDGNRYKLHHKVFIVDGATVITGSYNFSRSAEERNDENVLIIHDPDLAFRYLQEFANRWLEAGGAQ